MFHNSICLNIKVEDSAKILLDMLSQKTENKLPTDAVQHLRRSNTRPPHSCVFMVWWSGTISLYWADRTIQMQKAASSRTSADIYQFMCYHNHKSWIIIIYIYIYVVSPKRNQAFEIAHQWAGAGCLWRWGCVAGTLSFIFTLATSCHFN